MPSNPSEFELLAETRQLAASGQAKEIRLAAHFSLIDIAEPIGVTHSAVSRWENGLRVPRGEVALKYGRLLRTLQKSIKHATVAEIRAAAEAKANREAAHAAKTKTAAAGKATA